MTSKLQLDRPCADFHHVSVNISLVGLSSISKVGRWCIFNTMLHWIFTLFSLGNMERYAGKKNNTNASSCSV